MPRSRREKGVEGVRVAVRRTWSSRAAQAVGKSVVF
jgi:hypothetical protein